MAKIDAVLTLLLWIVFMAASTKASFDHFSGNDLSAIYFQGYSIVSIAGVIWLKVVD